MGMIGTNNELERAQQHVIAATKDEEEPVEGSNEEVADTDVKPSAGRKWEILQKIGSGSFGDVYVGLALEDDSPPGGTEVAIKVEDSRRGPGLLHHEAEVLRTLEGQPGFPSVISSICAGKYQIMIMDRYHLTLENLRIMAGGNFSTPCVCVIATQLIQRLQSVHEAGYVHRDIKPDNFMIGFGKDRHTVKMIDFGFAKAWRKPDGSHAPLVQGKKFSGTPRYGSLNAHNGLEQSRRDDLWALGHLLVFLARGRLPWDKAGGNSVEDRIERIVSIMRTTPVGTTVSGLPACFKSYFNYVTSLSYEQQPDYAYLQALFSAEFEASCTRPVTRTGISAALPGGQPNGAMGTLGASVVGMSDWDIEMQVVRRGEVVERIRKQFPVPSRFTGLVHWMLKKKEDTSKKLGDSASRKGADSPILF